MGLAATLIRYELMLQAREIMERRRRYQQCRAYCDSVDKPLLQIGVRTSPLNPPYADTTLDIDPVVLRVPGGVQGDERDMPFEDKEFGACINSHTLEHLHSAEDVELALNESVRVADMAVFLAPSPYSFIANFLCPNHHLRLYMDQQNNRIVVVPNRFRTGVGINAPAILHQGLVSLGRPPVVIRG